MWQEVAHNCTGVSGVKIPLVGVTADGVVPIAPQSLLTQFCCMGIAV